MPKSIAVLILLLFSSCLSLVAAEQKEKNASAKAIAEQLKTLVPKIRKEKKLVGLAAMIMVKGKVIATAVDGDRKKGSGNKLDIADRWHVGSITKSMTATMIGRLVEQKKLSWTLTIGECFGKSLKIHKDWNGVTLEQLLTHTSGARPNFSLAVKLMRPKEGPARMAGRKMAIEGVLSKPPSSKPGKRFSYSNVGFTIAGAMAEHKTGKSWEALVRQEVFKPLKARDAGFGPPKSTKGKLDQPRGHQNIAMFKRAVGENDDNTPIMGPAGTVHMSLRDLCNFGNEHLNGERGGGKLLKAATYKRLHTPKLGDYAFGWVAPKKNNWTEGRVLWHNGSNTLWYALLVILPDHDAVIAVTSNDGDIKRAQSGAIQIVKEFGKIRPLKR